MNFDGKKDGGASLLAGYSDWDGIALNRLGAGRHMAGMSQGLDFGGLDFGGLDFGGLDFGGLDFGGLDFGGLDFGGLDFGGLDFGGLDFGGLDFGGLDFGGLDFGGLDFGGLEAEVDAELTVEIVERSHRARWFHGPGCIQGVRTRNRRRGRKQFVRAAGRDVGAAGRAHDVRHAQLDGVPSGSAGLGAALVRHPRLLQGVSRVGRPQ